MSTARRGWPVVVMAFVVAHVLSIGGWVTATIVTRHLRGDGFRPPEYHGLLGWVSWDGGFYRVIAQHGYPASSAEAIRFFPLYPLVARWLTPLAGGSTDLALFIVAKVAMVIALFGIRALVIDERGSEATAGRSVWLFVLFPGAFVLTWAYSEALLAAVTIWGIRELRRRRWWTAAGLGLLAGLCRPIGVALAAAALVEVIRHWPPRPRREALAQAAAVAGAPVGTLLFCWYSAVRGFGFFAPFTTQDSFRGTQSPLERLWSLPGTLTGHDAFTTGLHVPFVIAFLVLLVVTFRVLPASYGMFSAVILVAALSAQNLNSIERYATSAFPLAITAALSLESRDRVEPAVYAIGGALSIALCALALTGSYVP